ncbi:MAG: hypothetical protein AB7S26_18740 [Sandaracinaceae bacterium]
MTKLADVLNSPEKKRDVVRDCLGLLDAEVADKGGISGLAIKAGYATVKGVKPGFVERVVDGLLPEFADACDPVYSEAVDQGKPIAGYFVAQSSRVADSLLAITDAKAERSDKAVVRKTYEKLRGQAKKNVEQAIPRLGRLIEKYAG